MDVNELIKEVRRIEIKSRMIVDQISGGAYRSRFKGRGMEFEEVRDYIPGDDIRDIDWNVTARMGLPFIKKYSEERELHVLIVVDVSGSELYGSGEKSKIRTETELAAMLALSAIRNNDKVGLITFTDDLVLRLPMQSGRSHVLRIIRELVASEPLSPRTNLDKIFSTLYRILNKRTVIFFISDMLDNVDKFAPAMRLVSRAHDLIICRIADPIEMKGLPSGHWALSDSETGDSGLVYMTRRKTRHYQAKQQLEDQQLEDTCLRAKAGFIPLVCGEDFVHPMMNYFKGGKQKRR